MLFVLLFFFQVIQKNQNLTSKTADPPSAAILAIYLDQAYELPVRLSLQDFFMGCIQFSPVSHINVFDML